MCPASLFIALALAASPVDEIAESAATAGHPAALVRMQAWVDAHSADAEAGRALVWMGKVELNDGHPERARVLYGRAAAEHPGTEWALAAEAGLADVAALSRHYSEAISRYHALSGSASPYYAFIGQNGEKDARSARARDWVALALAVLLFALAASRLTVARLLGKLWPPPEELVYAAPAVAVMLAAALGQPAAEARAVAVVALGGLFLLWANAAFLRARAPGRMGLVREGVLSLLQASALVYCAVVANGLYAKLLVTLSVGPE